MAEEFDETRTNQASVSGVVAQGSVPRAKPLVGRIVMDMVGPGEADEEVDVEQVGHGSSSAAPTISGVISGASAPTLKTGNPPSELIRSGRGARPRRARSEITLPSDLRCAVAGALAACRTSSSM